MSWTNPTRSDFVGTIIRYRTDAFPTSVSDGALLCDRTAAPGSTDSFVHGSLSNGTTYYYSAFTYNNLPIYSAAVTASGTPVGPRVTVNSSQFSSGADGWMLSLWKADPQAVNASILWNAGAGRTGGGIRCAGGGITDDSQRCLREGGEIRKTISTVGHERLQVSYDVRVNTLGANITGVGTGGCAVDHNLVDEQLTIFYSTDGGTNWSEAEYITRSTLLGYQSYGTRQVDLSGIIGCSDNPNFALRFRWQLNSESDAADLDNIIVTGTTLGTADTTPPGMVTSFSAVGGDRQVALSWTNPLDSDFIGTMVRYKTTGYPTSRTDGTLACNKLNAPGSNDTFTHTGLTNGVVYYYSAFAYDGVPNYSAKSDASATPADTTPPANVSGFSAIRGNTRNTLIWTNPGTSDFTGTMIRFKTTGYPTGPTDGILVINKAGAPGVGDSFVHQGLTNGPIHYYRAYSHDAAPNYASGMSAAVNPAYFDPYSAKLLSNYATAVVTESVVSASFADMFYIQSPDKRVGIRVDQPGHSVQSGQSVGVRGTVLTDVVTDEKYILADWSAAHASGAVAPVSMGNASVGGIDWSYNSVNGVGQRGLASAIGPNNTGLLVRVWGKITQRQTLEPKYFYIDDGSGMIDGTKTGTTDNIGIRVLGDPSVYSEGDYLVITGISSCFKVGTDLRPRILPLPGGIEKL